MMKKIFLTQYAVDNKSIITKLCVKLEKQLCAVTLTKEKKTIQKVQCGEDYNNNNN